jgi:hypothetical protein
MATFSEADRAFHGALPRAFEPWCLIVPTKVGTNAIDVVCREYNGEAVSRATWNGDVLLTRYTIQSAIRRAPMRTPILLITLSILSLVGCVHPEPVQTTLEPPYPERNSAADPILAVFVGRIPCAVKGCNMRKIELVLYGRDDGQAPTTYWLGQTGVGMGNDRLVQQGTWTARHGVQEYPDALVYALDSSADRSLQYLWRVTDEILLVLDQNMRPRAGNGAWGFMLSRNCAPYGQRTYPYDQRAKRFVSPAPSGSNCAPPIAKN